MGLEVYFITADVTQFEMKAMIHNWLFLKMTLFDLVIPKIGSFREHVAFKQSRWLFPMDEDKKRCFRNSSVQKSIEKTAGKLITYCSSWYSILMLFFYILTGRKNI